MKGPADRDNVGPINPERAAMWRRIFEKEMQLEPEGRRRPLEALLGGPPANWPAELKEIWLELQHGVPRVLKVDGRHVLVQEEDRAAFGSLCVLVCHYRLASARRERPLANDRRRKVWPILKSFGVRPRDWDRVLDGRPVK